MSKRLARVSALERFDIAGDIYRSENGSQATRINGNAVLFAFRIRLAEIETEKGLTPVGVAEMDCAV
jgi:hypothetical protein